MSHTQTSRPRRLLGRRARTLAAAGVAAAVGVSGLAAAPVATSATTADCPQPYPVASLAKGQAVTGKTVTSGTEPTGFSGEVLGVIRDGIAPGLDMVIARLSSPEIDRVGGIWQGMSGSPVYAPDGRLIGAVAYGLAWGPSPVAGITPAEEMYHLLDLPSSATAQKTLRIAAAKDSVAIPTTLVRRIVNNTAVDRDEAQDGMSRLPVPFGISGMVSGKRLRQAKNALDLSGVRVHQSGSVSAAETAIPVAAGSNLAASLSYGDVSAIGTGTATAVCGEEVLAFGHPMTFSGPTELTMHGADAIYVQEDSVGPPFKVANAAAPIGGITQDRLAGIFGLQSASAVPETTDITSYVEVPGERSRTGTTKISFDDAVPDIAAFHLLADQDRVFDGIGPGSASVGWTITGTRADGRTFTLTRADKFANDFDISFEPTFDLYDQLARLHFNDIEDITLNKIQTTSTMIRVVEAYTITKVRILAGGRWQDLRTDRPLPLRPGTVRRFRVLMTSAELGKARVEISVPVPDRIGQKSGVLDILGGNSFFPEGSGDFAQESFGGSTGPTTFEGLLQQIRRMPRNDQVLANLTLFKRDGSLFRRSYRADAKAVVNGGVSIAVQGMGAGPGSGPAVEGSAGKG